MKGQKKKITLTSTCPSISQFSSFIFIIERVLNFKDIYTKKKTCFIILFQFQQERCIRLFSYFAINKFKKYIFYSRENKRKARKTLFIFIYIKLENLFIFKNESFTFNEVCTVYFIFFFFL